MNGSEPSDDATFRPKSLIFGIIVQIVFVLVMTILLSVHEDLETNSDTMVVTKKMFVSYTLLMLLAATALSWMFRITVPMHYEFAVLAFVAWIFYGNTFSEICFCCPRASAIAGTSTEDGACHSGNFAFFYTAAIVVTVACAHFAEIYHRTAGKVFVVASIALFALMFLFPNICNRFEELPLWVGIVKSTSFFLLWTFSQMETLIQAKTVRMHSKGMSPEEIKFIRDDDRSSATRKYAEPRTPLYYVYAVRWQTMGWKNRWFAGHVYETIKFVKYFWPLMVCPVGLWFVPLQLVYIAHCTRRDLEEMQMITILKRRALPSSSSKIFR